MTEEQNIEEILNTWDKQECFKFAIWCAKKAAKETGSYKIYSAIDMVNINVNNSISIAINDIIKIIKSSSEDTIKTHHTVVTAALAALGTYHSNEASHNYALTAAQNAAKAIAQKNEFSNFNFENLFWEYVGEVVMLEIYKN